MMVPRGWFRAVAIECARSSFPPDEPGVLRAVAGVAWRLEYRLRARRAAAFVAEARRSLGAGVRAAEGVAHEAHDTDLQRRLEELVLGRVEPEWFARYAALDGVAADEPACFVALGAPHPLIGVHALALARPGLLALHPAPPAPPDEPRADRWLRTRFATLRHALPVEWSSDPEHAATALAAGRSVHAVLTRADDGAVGDLEAALAAGLVLGRPLHAFVATLGAAPLRLLLVHRERDKRWRVEATEPVTPEQIVPRFAQHIRRWPGQTLPWLCGRVDGGDAPH
ncbi:MAG: hypothetical protein EXR71_12895 [Myxococcales bacterium]|nr:hypothetical protein [Myxococcales bacterium]